MVLYWSRDDLFAFSRVRCDIERSLRETVSRLGLRRRGRRAGRCRPVAAGIATSPLPALNVNNNKRSADYAAATVDFTAVQHQLPASIIPTVIGRCTLSTYRRQHPAHKRVLIHVKRSPSSVRSKNVSWQQPAAVQCASFVPSLYILNAAALAKPYAVNQLSVELTNYDADVAVITETHFKTKHFGYTLSRRDRQGRRGGGVAIYVRSTLHFTPWKYSADDRSFELQWIQVGGTFFGALYHPPRSLYMTDSLVDYIEACVDELVRDFPTASVVLAGDLNQLTDSAIMQRTGLTQIVTQPTRGSSLLDRIFVSSPAMYSVRVVTSVVRSDHKAIIAFADFQRVTGKKLPRKFIERSHLLSMPGF